MNDWLSKFQIAKVADGVDALTPLSDLIVAEPNAYAFQRFRRVVGRNGVGANVRVGFPFAVSTWRWLPQQDIDILQEYEAQELYVRCETDTGVTSRDYQIFRCYAQPLELGETDRNVGFDAPDDGLRQRRPVSWEWSSMVAVE